MLRRRGCPAPSRSRFPSDRRKLHLFLDWVKKSENFSKSRGRPSSRCRRVLGRLVALLRVDVENFPIAPRKILLHAPAGSHLTTIRRGTLVGEKFSKFFLSALAGQVVDVGASLAGGLTRRRVDVDWRAIANDRAGEGATCR